MPCQPREGELSVPENPRHCAWDAIDDLLPNGLARRPEHLRTERPPLDGSWPAPRTQADRCGGPSRFASAGEDELAALTDLALRLRELRKARLHATLSGGPGSRSTRTPRAVTGRAAARR